MVDENHSVQRKKYSFDRIVGEAVEMSHRGPLFYKMPIGRCQMHYSEGKFVLHLTPEQAQWFEDESLREHRVDPDHN